MEVLSAEEYRHRFALMKDSMRRRLSSLKGATPITCTKCGHGGGTLHKVGDAYEHNTCPYRHEHIPTLAEVWADRRPVVTTDEQVITKPENLIEVPASQEPS